MAMIRVTEVEALPKHRLFVKFSDGTSGEVDMSSHVQRKTFLNLQDEAVFRGAIVELGAVEWPDGGVGIATEALYALAHELKHPNTLEEARANERTALRRTSTGEPHPHPVPMRNALFPLPIDGEGARG